MHGPEVAGLGDDGEGAAAFQRCGEACERRGRSVARAGVGPDRVGVFRQDPAAAHGPFGVGSDMEHEFCPTGVQRVGAECGQRAAGRGAEASVGLVGPCVGHPPVGSPDGIGRGAVLGAGLGDSARARGHELGLLAVREGVGGRGPQRARRGHHHRDPAAGERLAQPAADAQIVGNDLGDGVPGCHAAAFHTASGSSEPPQRG